MSNTAKDMLNSASDTAQKLAHDANDTMHRVGHDVSAEARRLRDRLSEGTEGLSEAARERVVAARHRAVEARRQASSARVFLLEHGLLRKHATLQCVGCVRDVCGGVASGVRGMYAGVS